MTNSFRASFERHGYLGPLPVLSKAGCEAFMATHRRASGPPLDWGKGLAPRSRAFYDIATHPAIMETVMAVIGDDLMLWGASVLTKGPGVVHPWHSDIESSSPTGRTVSVWLAIENVTRDSSLMVIPHSHEFRMTVQQVRQETGLDRDAATTEAVVAWAQHRDRRCRLVIPDMTDGEAVFFDGRLWHGTHNRLDRTRTALLIQFAAPDTPIRIPDFNQLDWPFRSVEHPKPACIMVRGTSGQNTNRYVPAPTPEVNDVHELTSRVQTVDLPLEPDESGWKPFPLFKGVTADVRLLSCHASALASGHAPHEPHRHSDEELLLVLDGEVNLLLPDAEEPITRIGKGEFVYYPSNFPHTLLAVGDRPANYLMFKWRGDAGRAENELAYGRFQSFEPASTDAEGVEGWQTRRVFEGPTRYLRKLHCHTSTLSPGAGYEPHVDAYDVALIILDGEVETLGGRAEAGSVIFYRAGEPHGIRNPGTEEARYIVFEFHGWQSAGVKAFAEQSAPGFMQKVSDPRRWKRRIRKTLAGR